MTGAWLIKRMNTTCALESKLALIKRSAFSTRICKLYIVSTAPMWPHPSLLTFSSMFFLRFKGLGFLVHFVLLQHMELLNLRREMFKRFLRDQRSASTSALDLSIAAVKLRQLHAPTSLALGNHRHGLEELPAITLALTRRRHLALRHSHELHVPDHTIRLFRQHHPAVPFHPGGRLHHRGGSDICKRAASPGFRHTGRRVDAERSPGTEQAIRQRSQSSRHR